MLFAAFSNSSLMYSVSATILVVEHLLQSLMNGGTAFNYPKYLNLFYLLDSADFWGNYVNLNLFTNPISVYRADILIFTIVFVACFAITIVLFIQKEQQSRIGFFSASIEKFITKHRKISGSTGILLGELYKYLVLNKMAMVLIILLCFGVVSAIGTVSYPYADISDSEYKTYMATLQGEVTAEKENYIAEEQAFFDSLHQRIEEYADDTSLSESAKSVAINTINRILDTKGKAFERVAEQYERLLALRNEGREVGFIDENLYSTFVASPTREWRNLITLFFVLLISVPFIFTVEYQRNMITLLRSTKCGKRNLYAKKLVLAFATLVIAFIAVYLPYYIRFTNTYGTQNFNTPIACMGMYQHISGSLSVIGSAVLNAACYFAIALAGVSVIILICTTVKSHLLSVIISTVILVLPCLVLYPYENVRVGTIFSGSYATASVFIIMLSIIMTAICLTTSSVQFTNKRMGGKKHVRA